MSTQGELFNENLSVVNIGIESFYNTMMQQNVPVVHVEWKPPAGGNDRLISLLDQLKK